MNEITGEEDNDNISVVRLKSVIQKLNENRMTVPTNVKKMARYGRLTRH